MRYCMDESAQWREHCERQPLLFLDRELFPHVVRVIKEVAPILGADAKDMVFLPNATTGLNVVAKSISLTPGDTIFMLDVGYGSVKKILQAVAEQAGATLVFGAVSFPISGPEDIVEVVRSSMPASTKFAVFDAVTSNTALVLPLQQLVSLCHDRGVQVLVDGAHALGMLPLDLASLQPDYFVTNCHKWFCGPRGTAIMWVRPDRKAGIRPLITSHGSGHGFTSDFIWDGCRDYAPILGLSAAARFWQVADLSRAQDYMRSLLGQAVELLVAAWGTDTLAPLEMCGAMALVRLPEGVSGREVGGAGSEDAKYLQDVLHYQHKVECPVKCIQGRLYVRISAHIYNQLQDYRVLAEAVLALITSASRRQDEQE